MNAELPVVLEEMVMGALLVPAGDLPFNANWPMVGCFGVVALVGVFPSVLLKVRERDEDPDLEKRWGSSGDSASGWSTQRHGRLTRGLSPTALRWVAPWLEALPR